MLWLGEQDFAVTGHDSFDANRLVMVTPRQATSLPALEEAIHKRGHAAKVLVPEMKLIDIPRSVSLSVFRDSLRDSYNPMTKQLLPGV